MVILGKLVAFSKEICADYTHYVFECLDEEIKKQTKYVMCTKHPNWESKPLKLGEVGYVHIEERRAGIDKWYDGINFIPYRYDDVQFMKFIPKPIEEDYKFIM